MNPKSLMLIGLFLVGAYSTGCRTTSLDASLNDEDVLDARSQYLGLGEEGRSGTLGNIFTFYVDGQDPQPRCLGCRTVRVLYDGRLDPQPMGGTVATDISLDLSGACESGTQTEFANLTAINRSLSSPLMGSAMIFAPNCDYNATITVNAKGLTCLNPTAPECMEMRTIDSAQLTLAQLFGLDFYSGSGVPNSAQSDEGDETNHNTDNDNISSAFIGLGDAGVSGNFANKLTVYRDAQDPQPRCLGCSALRLVYDDLQDPMPMGATVVSQFVIDLDSACEGASPVVIDQLYAIYRSPYSPRYALFQLTTPPGRCDQDGYVSIQAQAMRCMNPSAPECSEMQTRESYRVRLGDLFSLDFFEGGPGVYPNTSGLR